MKIIEITKTQLIVDDVPKPEEYEVKVVKIKEGKVIAHDKIVGITKEELLALKEEISQYKV